MLLNQDDNATGTDTRLKPYGNQFSTGSDVQGERSFSYNSAAQTLGSPDSGVSMQRRIPSNRTGAGQDSQPKSTPARRDALRRGIQQAVREAEAMVSAARDGESTRLSNSAFSLRDTLQDLWDLRDERDDDWGDLLNTLQIAFGVDDYDALSVAQCVAVKQIISEILVMRTVDVSDIEASVQLLRKSGLDPFGWSSTTSDVDAEIDETQP